MFLTDVVLEAEDTKRPADSELDDVDKPEKEEKDDKKANEKEDTQDDEKKDEDKKDEEKPEEDEKKDSEEDTDMDDIEDDIDEDLDKTKEEDLDSDEPSDSENSDDTSDDSGQDKNTDHQEVKNYVLIKDFITFYNIVKDTIETISDTNKVNRLASVIINQVQSNLSMLKISIFRYIHKSFNRNKYVENLYQYNCFIEAFKINIEMIKKIKELDV